MKSFNNIEMSDAILRIRERFVDGLNVMHSRMVELRHHLEEPERFLSALMEIGKISHKISGTAATLGFSKLGTRASAIDDAIDQNNSTYEIPISELLNMIDCMISDMAEAIADSN
jgi:HPt (histidine-containing phosphotransfer) domain-containing protein